MTLKDRGRLSRHYFAILEKVVQLILAIIVMTYYSWVFTVVMLGMTVAMFLIPSYFTKKLQDATEGFSQSQAKLTQGINEVTGGFRVIKSFRLETNRMARFAEQNNGQAQAGKKLGFYRRQMRPFPMSLPLRCRWSSACLPRGLFFREK